MLRQVVTVVRIRTFSWREKGSVVNPAARWRLMSHLRKKKLRTLMGRLSACMMPAFIMMRSPTKLNTVPRTTEMAIDRSVTWPHVPGSGGWLSKTRSTDDATLTSPIVASMGEGPELWRVRLGALGVDGGVVV